MQTKIKWYPSIKMLETNQFNKASQVNWNQPFSLEEKLDGSNISFIKYNDQLYCFSRNQLIIPKDFKDFDHFLTKWSDLIKNNLHNGEILNAEYIKQGRIKYVFDEKQIPNLVLFDLGVVNEQWLNYVFNNQVQPDEALVNKITFYPLSVLQERFKEQPFKFATIQKITLEPVYDLDDHLEDLIINCDGQPYRLSDQFETFLNANYFQGHSLIFATTNSVEGVILKSADGQIRLKYVFQAWKNLRKTKTNKQLKKELIDQNLITFLEKAINERWEKWFDYLYWNDEPNNPFKGSTNIYKQIRQNPHLISLLLKFKTWLLDDIYQELEPKSQFDQNYFKNHWQLINQLMTKLTKKILKDRVELQPKLTNNQTKEY